jgi:hypothetical protein
MFERGIAAAIALTAALGLGNVAMAFDDAKYPDLTGQWVAVRIPGVRGQPAFDPTKPWGLGQEAPLTPEYQKVLEASIADQARGGQGGWPTGWCLPPGMPAMMTLYRPMEIIVLPEITYILIDHAINSHRRIYTDGRDWPAQVEPSFDVIPSANGSIPTIVAATACWRLRPGISRARAPSTRPDCPPTPTTRRWSRSASSSTRPIRRCCTMK